MLRNNFVAKGAKLENHGFLISVEAEQGTGVEHIQGKLADALTWVEGVGNVDVTYLGIVDMTPDEDNKL